MKLKLLNVVGARPNFIKIAPLFKEYRRHKNIQAILVHTGQHYSQSMSDNFFQSLKIPKPHYNLAVGSASHAVQKARIMMRLEKVLEKEKPQAVLVVGDVNSTLAASLTAVKMGIKVAHVEAGLRSYDKSMPEEINRLLTDHLSDWLFVTEDSGVDNLKKEGIDDKKIHFVGNVMIDNLIYYLSKINRSKIIKNLGLTPGKYIISTLHRPINVDLKQNLEKVLHVFKLVPKDLTVVFSCHPRTKKNIRRAGLWTAFCQAPNLKIIGPQTYFDLLALIKNSFCVFPDSGGIQAEAAFLRVPTLTLREITERPATIQAGANQLMRLDDGEEILKSIADLRRFDRSRIKPLPHSDGRASKRIVDILCAALLA
jgi:UDP-N-acetylglucosamine 2-epimerase (non-hydrolysing)